MDKYFNSYREMISLRGLTDHTLKSYSTYIRSYLDYLLDILHKSPEDVSWNELRDYVKWLQKSRNLSDRTITLENNEFIRRFLMHVLPCGFQKIRYYGFLNNRMKSQNLKLIFKLQGYQKFKQCYAGMSMAQLLDSIWHYDVRICPVCGCYNTRILGKNHLPSG